ncbi:MAG: hypothetical protein NT076_01230 [Candidatus Pacearchaeota archaeon]|nr:hypothetical protein [Candidatus Pacearchaeota archaeon]
MFRKLRDKLNKSKIGMNVNESLLGRAIDSLSNFIVYAYATLAGDTALKEDSAVNLSSQVLKYL